MVPPRHDVDGGMNPVFADKIVTQPGYDSKGQPILVATAPGALPRESNSNRQAPIVSVPRQVETGETTPVVLASVPMPQPAPEPKIGEAPPAKPTSIAGLIGNMFSGSDAQAEAAAPSEPVAQPPKPLVLRGSNSDTAKSKHAKPVLTVSQPKPHAVAAAKPKIEPKTESKAAPRSWQPVRRSPPMTRKATRRKCVPLSRHRLPAPTDILRRRATGGAGRFVRRALVGLALVSQSPVRI